MNWEKLFAPHILKRGFYYHCEYAVENLDVTEDGIRADVIGTEDYEVEISLENGDVTNMYCSCPYAESGNNCKHMAAVLFEWSEECDDDLEKNEETDEYIFTKPSNTKEYRKKTAAIEELVREADIDVVRSYLASVLSENKKLLVRFNSIIHKQIEDEDIGRYMYQIDHIADRYSGRNHYISYYEANGFISELQEILDVDIRRFIDNKDYMNAFKLMNYILILLSNVDMDDSDGGTGMLVNRIYEFWLELLIKVDKDEKKTMFCWFTEHLDGSILDYLEEYVEKIIMEEFCEEEFEQLKLQFIKDMVDESSSKDSEWSREYHTGKWAVRYLGMIEKKKNSKKQIEEFCKTYWDNSSIRRFYIDFCMKNKDYVRALEVLDQSISMDRQYSGLISEYSEKKKEIYLLQGDRDAYIEQLWKLVLEDKAGNLNIYKELKKQYAEEEWITQREEIFSRLPKYADISQLYKEEKLYDRLLDYVMKSTGLYMLQQYENVLKKEYPEQLLQRYKAEVNDMAVYPHGRKAYQQLVALLRRMKKIKNGSKVVADIVAEWKERYRNRPAMMDELNKL